MSSQLELLNLQTLITMSKEGEFSKPKSGVGELRNNKRTIENALKDIFPTKQEETMLERARRILGDDVIGILDEDLEKYVTEFQELIDFWLDSCEKEIFDNKTLRELIREG
ncbi:MAG: hypothetical protein BWY68_00439 [bacterium ADurb.Bin400]|nr:MAG: hypothetical protein BWY68_00439 [bacterium ADurb.Bin400]